MFCALSHDEKRDRKKIQLDSFVKIKSFHTLQPFANYTFYNFGLQCTSNYISTSAYTYICRLITQSLIIPFKREYDIYYTVEKSDDFFIKRQDEIEGYIFSCMRARASVIYGLRSCHQAREYCMRTKGYNYEQIINKSFYLNVMVWVLGYFTDIRKKRREVLCDGSGAIIQLFHPTF